MLFLARYTVDLADVEVAMAKRLEWEELRPEGIRILGEWTVQGVSEPLTGVFVFETDDVEVLNTLVMYYGRTVKLDIRPCSDVLSAIETTQRTLGRVRSEPSDEE